MNLSWFFNGTMEAHHLAAAYLVVWAVQGGYATWIAIQWSRLKRRTEAEPLARPSSISKKA